MTARFQAAAGAGPAVEEHPAFDGVPPDVWRSFDSAGGLYTSRRFMAALESVEPADGTTARLLVARDPDGTTAALPVFDVAKETGGRYDPLTLLRSIDADCPPPPSGATVLLGGRAGYENRFLLSPGMAPPPRRRAVRALVEAAIRPADGPAAHTWSMPYLDSGGAAEFRAALPETGEIALTAADTVLDIPQDGLDGYLAGLPSKRRIEARREMRAFAASGCTTHLAPLREVHGELAGLLARRLGKYGQQEDEAALERVLAGYGKVFGDDALVLLARSAGRAVAYVSLYRWRDTLYARSWGSESSQGAREAALYFNLVYYEPVSRAPELGVRSIHYGIMAYEAKVRRGARLEPRWTAVHSAGLEPDAFATAVARWNEQQLASFNALAHAPWHDLAASLARGGPGGEAGDQRRTPGGRRRGRYDRPSGATARRRQAVRPVRRRAVHLRHPGDHLHPHRQRDPVGLRVHDPVAAADRVPAGHRRHGRPHGPAYPTGGLGQRAGRARPGGRGGHAHTWALILVACALMLFDSHGTIATESVLATHLEPDQIGVAQGGLQLDTQISRTGGRGVNGSHVHELASHPHRRMSMAPAFSCDVSACHTSALRLPRL